MRLVLEAHPAVFCYDEIKGYAILQKYVPDDLPYVRLIGFKLPRWTEQLTFPVLFDGGPEGPCDNFYQREKILFLYREVYDTVASMLKLKVAESNWCEVQCGRIIKTKLAHDDTFRARYSEEFDEIERCNKRVIGLAALYWKYKTDSFFRYRDAGFPVLGVSYERLVTNPRHVLQSVCAHLGIAFHENLLQHGEFEHTEVVENGLTLGNTDPAKPIFPDSVGQWQRYLTAEDRELIAKIAGDLPARIAALSKE